MKPMKNITDEEIRNLAMFITENDTKIVDQIVDIVRKIIEMPKRKITSIAELIDYDRSTLVDPLIQGKVSNSVNHICKTLGIRLVEADKSLGGLAYFYKFKKV